MCGDSFSQELAQIQQKNTDCLNTWDITLMFPYMATFVFSRKFSIIEIRSDMD